MKGYSVEPISYDEARPWIMKKHYAHRMPPVSYVYGLLTENELAGVCTFGDGGGNTKLHKAFDGFSMLELNRLCLNDGLVKNTASFFISRCLKQLPCPTVIISYADAGQGHIGYIYQALNFIYTGLIGSRSFFKKNGITIHPKTLYDLFGSSSNKTAIDNGYTIELPSAKHRYILFIGNKREKQKMSNSMKWGSLPYPKGETKRYDASSSFMTQKRLF